MVGLEEEDDSDVEIEVDSEDEVARSGSEDENDEMEECEEEELEAGSESEENLDDDEESVDLAQATSKALLRLKRGNLVKLCEERELEADGTKKELVQNLLDWRDTNEEDGVMSQSSVASPRSSQGSSTGSSVTPTAESKHKSADETRKKPITGTILKPISLQSVQTIKIEEPSTMVQGSDPQRPDTSNRAQEDVNAEDEKRQQGSTKKDEIGELLDLESLNLQDKEIQSDQLKKFELIGSGGFKDVYRGVYRKVPVAIADIRGHLTEMDIKELKILRDLRHENIVRFIGVSVPEESLKRTVPIMIVSELCTNGDLFDYIRKVPNPGFLKICGIFRDICKGLDYLHSNVPVIIHRDLKSSNVLITSRGVAKLNDFGLARIKNSTRSMVKSLVGTVNWQAPELWVAHPRYNEKVDVYSAGLVLWEMLQWHQITKRYPFEGQNEHAIYQEVGQRQIRPATAGMRRQWGDELLNFIERLWNQNPSERPTMRESIREIDRIAQQFKANNK
ncbi:kinase-like protein [Phakopsora pachyrhizi]|nr:kinase-like protein [Phakopsora pachyrhizi]KAI8447414.1 kinase-like protein [Phakopsora pachyrhizi]